MEIPVDPIPAALEPASLNPSASRHSVAFSQCFGKTNSKPYFDARDIIFCISA